MGVTLDDIAAQRAMIERGEEIRKAARQAEERERLRDTFAAAALTGYAANPAWDDVAASIVAEQAYVDADAMLRERSRTGQAAAGTPPQSRAGRNASETVPEVAKCTERENTRPGEGTGNTSSPGSYDQSDKKRTDANTDGDIATRLRQTRADMIGTDDEQHYWDCHDAAGEIDRLRLELSVQKACTVAGREEIASLREAIRRLAEQDATLSVQGGSVTVTMDATLTAEEREAIGNMIHLIECQHEDYGKEAHALRNLLERLT